MPTSFMFIELFLFHAIVLAWAFYEYRKTSKLLETSREEECKAKESLQSERASDRDEDVINPLGN